MENLVVISSDELKEIVKETVIGAFTSFSQKNNYGNKFRDTVKKYLNIQELSELLGIPVKTLYQYNYQRKIPYINRFKKVLYNREQIEKWLEEGSLKSLKS